MSDKKSVSHTKPKVKDTHRAEQILLAVKKAMFNMTDPLSKEAVVLETITLQTLLEFTQLGEGLPKVKKPQDLETLIISSVNKYIELQISRISSSTTCGTNQTDLYQELRETSMGMDARPPSPNNVPIDDFEPIREEEDDSPKIYFTDAYEELQKEEDKNEQYYRNFPNLPKMRCPHHLFINNLRPKYLDSLYITNPNVFPTEWFDLKRKDPKQAWIALNQKIIPFLNETWGKQGVNFTSSETLVDYYNINELKEAIVTTIRSCFSEPVTIPTTSNSSQNQPQLGLIEKMTQRIEELYRCVSSDVVKTRNAEIHPKVPMPVIQPRLITRTLPRESGSSLQSTMSNFGLTALLCTHSVQTS